MGITSFYFLCFFACILIIYYIIPGRLQWAFLLLCSLAYYLLTGNGLLIFYPLASAAVCYLGIRLIVRTEDVRKKKKALAAVLAFNLGILFLLKYINFGINTINGIAALAGHTGALLSGLHLLAPLGVSFYTFTLLGYVIDVYYGIAEPQTNFGRLALYGMYFPVMISGPILQYRECGEQFFTPHTFDYRKVTRGMQRMLWGLFKKLVIAERLRILVDTVYGQYQDYPGAFIWVATCLYAFQLYTDFSGCMDIVLGMSESLGLTLPENFKTPFFSKSISEYWRRWHITLGVWMKDYIFYPLLRSAFFTRLNKSWKNRFGKKKGKQYATFAAMFVLWFTVGVWHGGDWKYVIGSGLLHWFYIVMEELLEEPCARFMEKCHIDAKGKFIGAVRILRTFFLVCIGDLFFRAESVAAACAMLKSAVTTWNPAVLWNGALMTLGLDSLELTIAALSLLLLLIVSCLQQKGSVRDAIAKRALPLRWLIWYALLFYVILFGCYGPEYSAAEFIYQGF
ncbi:MAG: MBOAT family protein [Roseburia sp.]|nr:MBOAT family protein [Roseburia sp.]MCM1242096.1 MBOAT family protein [Roseburia sp.]